MVADAILVEASPCGFTSARRAFDYARDAGTTTPGHRRHESKQAGSPDAPVG
jgi:hypothetical protein